MQQEAERVQEQQQQQQQEHAIKELMDSCPVRAGGAALGGYGLGLAFGLFLSSADWNASDKFLQMSTRDQIKHTFKDMAKRSHQGAKHWSLLGLVFSSTECVIESYRGKHDVWNSVGAGCFSGAAIAAKSGPQAMAVGCAGFAAFSVAIDAVLKNYDFD